MFGCFLLLAISLGAFNSSTSMYINPVIEDLGFGRGEFTFYRTIFLLVSAFLMSTYGKLIKKYGIKNMMLITSFLQGLVFASYSLSTEIWHFYIIAFIQGLFLNGVGFMSVGMLINKCFLENKGMAGAIAFCGSGAGSAILVPILTTEIINNGRRVVMASVGIVGGFAICSNSAIYD